MGGSTNAMIHVVAMARPRRRAARACDRFDEMARRMPVLANVRPSGQYLMEDFFYAGGMRALLARLVAVLDLDCPTVNGRTHGREHRRRRGLQRRSHPPARQSGWPRRPRPSSTATSRPTGR